MQKMAGQPSADATSIQHSTSTLESRVYPETHCVVHNWIAESTDIDNVPVVILYHGYGAHALFPTVRYAAEVCRESPSYISSYAHIYATQTIN
jgi:hypothetical protein